MAANTVLKLSTTLDIAGETVPLDSGAFNPNDLKTPTKSGLQVLLRQQKLCTPPTWRFSWQMTALVAWLASKLPGSTSFAAIKTFLNSPASKKVFSEDVTVSHIMASGEGDFSVSILVQFTDKSPLLPTGAFPLGIENVGLSVVHTASS